MGPFAYLGARMDRIFGTLEVRAISEEQRSFEGIANTAALDDHGTIIEPDGARFTLPLPLLWQHDQHTPVGEISTAELRDGRWHVTGHIRKVEEAGAVKDATDRAWHSVKYKLVRGLSIGFRPLKTKANRFLEWAWRELSLVTIPSNAEASISLVRSSYLAASGEAPSPGVSGDSTTDNPSRRRKVKTYAERVTALENKRAANVARMEALNAAAEERGETKNESEQEEFDTLRDETRAVDRELTDVREMEKLNAAQATPVSAATTKDASLSRGGGEPAVRTVKLRAHDEPGIAMARVVRALVIGHRKHRDPEVVARELYPDDTVIRAAVAAHTTDDVGLVGDEGGVFADFVEYLRPRTIVGQFGQDGVPDTRAVPFRTPLISQTGGGDGYWVGEGAAKPLTKFAWSRTTLEPTKVANIAVITDELTRASSPAADGMIRDSLVDALRERLDIDFIDPNKAAVAGVSPASITNGVTRIRSTGNTEADVRADIRAVFGSFIDANNPPTSGVWIMPATTALALSLMANVNGDPTFPGIGMNGGRLFGLPVILSQYVPDDFSYVESTVTYTGAIVALVNARDIYVADEGGFAVDTSREASLEMADNPTGSSATPTAATLVSMFQTNSTAIRAERTINWARRRDSGVAVLDTVNWGE